MYGVGLHIVFIDANVLYSRTLRDWTLLSAAHPDIEAFQVRWSEDVLVEATYHLRRRHPEWNSAKIESVRRKLEQAFRDCRVTGYPAASDFSGSDPNDQHVHSAAVHCGADIVLTSDPAGLFPAGGGGDALPYEVWLPDDFLCWLDSYAWDVVHHVVREQSRFWARHHGEARLPEALEAAGAPLFADRVREHIREIALRG